MRAFSKILTATAVVGLMAAQPVSAATRSADSLPAFDAPVAMVDRTATPVNSSEEFGGASTAVLVVLFGAAAALIIALIDKDDDGIVDSPG